jgi:Holliday junction resolvase
VKRTKKPVRPRKINSRRKGAEGERELANRLSELGRSARRTAQRQGNAEDGAADVLTDVPGLHLECKRVARIGVARYYDQAVRDAAKTGRTFPVVAMRENRGDWLIMLSLADFVRLLEQSGQAGSHAGGNSHPPGTLPRGVLPAGVEVA